MSGFIEKSDGVYPAAGLQFNPSTTQAQDVDNENNNNNDQPQSPNTPLEHEDSQEIMVGEAGKAILLGDEIDLESDGGEDLYHRQSKGSLCCPNWLKTSSPRTKFILGGTAILLLSFVAIMIVGISQLSSSPTDNNDNGGGSSSIITDENTATVPNPPTPSPISSIITTTKEPTPNVLSIPTTESQVNILLPPYLEAKVPDFSDGLSVTEQNNWNEIEKYIERTISTSLSDNLPSEYFVESVQIDKFDGFLTGSIRRQLQNNEAFGTSTIHTVVYSTFVAVDCSISDCPTAPATVASATTDLAEMYIEVSADTKAPVASSAIITDTPTKSPVTEAPIVITPIPTIVVTTATPTKNPAPVTDAPTQPKYLDERINGCNIYTPCEACLGECLGDEQCDEGLLECL